jgi:replicative DNA helicase
MSQRALDTREDIDPMGLIADLDGELSEIGVGAERFRTIGIGKAFDECMEEIYAVEQGKPPAGFAIKLLKDWNAVAGRAEEGDMTLLGGRPSMGKTAVSVAIACGAAAAGEPTEYFSLEMDRRKLTRRAIANLIYQPGVTASYQDLINGKLGMQDKAAIAEARKLIESWPLNISDPALMYVEDVAPAIRRRQRELERKGQTLKLVIIDYLGRLKTRRRFTSETEEVSYISRTLKDTAKECKIALIVLVQLSRGVEARDNKRPMLADLRQSGSLEQDADTVVFVYRDEYYLERSEPPKDKQEKWNKWADEIAAVRDVMEMYSSKRREGALVKRLSKFFTAHQAVRDQDFFQWQANASPFSMFRDDEPVPGFEGFDIPEKRG